MSVGQYTRFSFTLGETFKEARALTLSNQTNDFVNDAPSMTRGTDVSSEPAEEFPAIFGCYQGISRTDIGWLTRSEEHTSELSHVD